MTEPTTGDRNIYPGDLATPDDFRRLAAEYQRAAHHLLELGRRGDPLSRAPYRLSAIHAVELYLSALLLHKGHEADRIRGLQHNLAARVDLAITGGLQLRQRTVTHLRTMSDNRE